MKSAAVPLKLFLKPNKGANGREDLLQLSWLFEPLSPILRMTFRSTINRPYLKRCLIFISRKNRFVDIGTKKTLKALLFQIKSLNYT